MKKIIVITYVTLDGVMQAPGGSEEDRSNGFKWGGWIAPHWDELMNEELGATMSRPFDLLLGRRTYEIFASHWPYIQNDPVADKFNSIQKYAVSNQQISLPWKNSTLITGDVVSELQQLKKQDGPDLLMYGSRKLIQTLLANDLVDELQVWTIPITIGEGKRLFEEGTKPATWKLTGSRVSTTGTLIARYEPAGEIKLHNFTPENPPEAELERRKKHAKEG
jgi:dihydrofolate reductase